MDPITNEDEDTKEGLHVEKLEKSEYKNRRSLSKIWNTVKKWNPLTKITNYLEQGGTKDMGKRLVIIFLLVSNENMNIIISQ